MLEYHKYAECHLFSTTVKDFATIITQTDIEFYAIIIIRRAKIKSDGKENYSEIQKISEKLGIKPLTARLLYNRGYTTAEDAEGFIKNENISFHDPFLLADMDKAVERILSAVDANEKIVIYGDYDVDGVTSVSILYLYLKEKGADVSYYIPSRTGEGYGINPVTMITR